MKPLKRSIALVIEGRRGVLLVRRPDDDESLPGLWGLPAASLGEGESEDEAVRRAGRAKLGVEVRPLRAVGESEDERPEYRIVMRDWAAEIEAGEPAVPQPAAGTQYVDWRWGDPGELAPAARAGSLCARILLRERHLGSWGMSVRPGILARGPWRADQVEARWRTERFEPPSEVERAADAAVHDLRERGSPAHDGLATRLSGWSEDSGRLVLELQPMRWAVRLVEGNACDSLTALCVVRSEDGRWLAGRRAGWVSTWANRWALGAGGAVDLGESPAVTLSRELREEWQLEPDRLSVEALLGLPDRIAMLVGLATVADGCDPVPDAEHDEWAWWPADPGGWPAEADERLRLMAGLLST